jgi:hypothetical protein
MMFVHINASLGRQFFLDTVIPAIAGVPGLFCFLTSPRHRTKFP